MHVDNDNGEIIGEPIAGPVTENGYDDVYDEEAEYDQDDAVNAPGTDAAERLGGLVTYLATNLVDDPENVEVEARQRGGSVFVSLRVPEEVLG